MVKSNSFRNYLETMISNSENIEDIRRMRQEAIKRVQEMQKRAKISLEYSNSGIRNVEKSLNIEKGTKESQSEQPNSLPYTKKEQNNALLNIKNLINDPEKSLILVLILLLADENVDVILLITLFYILI